MGILCDYCAKNSLLKKSFLFQFYIGSVYSILGFKVGFVYILCEEILFGSLVRATKLHSEKYRFSQLNSLELCANANKYFN